MSRAKGVTFTPEAAKQIADVVRQSSDTYRGQGGIGGGNNAQSSPHYLSKTTSAWNKGSSQTLTIWSGTPGSESAQTGDTVEAWNKIADVVSGAWVILGRANGTFYLVAHASDEGDQSSCKSKIGSLALSDITGYDGTKTQVLIHNSSGCLSWLNTTACT